MTRYDIVIIGAGPAGMSAAIHTSEKGLRTLVLDDQPGAGGQVYRGMDKNREQRAELAHLGDDYWRGGGLADRFARSPAEVLPESRVWQITPEREVLFSRRGEGRRVRAEAVLIATGAMERPVPVPGWTLPGVMTVGAAQTMLKADNCGADGAVFAGTGPLLYLAAWQYLEAGFRVEAVVDTAPSGMPLKHCLWGLPALLQPGMLLKGMRWRAGIRKGTSYFPGARDVRIVGGTRAEGLRFRDARGRERGIPAEHVFIHQGVVPNINLTMATELEHRWCPRQLCWHPQTDIYGESSIEGIFVAGDGGGIAGAAAAAISGRIAAARIAAGAAGPSPARILAWRLQRWRETAMRPFLDRLFAPPEDWRVPADDSAIVCRCEALTKADVSGAIGLGVSGPNQLKSFCRAGMGRCQGRMCGLTIQKMISDHHGMPEDRVGYYRLRPPVRPLTVGELAAMAEEDGGP